MYGRNADKAINNQNGILLCPPTFSSVKDKNPWQWKNHEGGQGPDDQLEVRGPSSGTMA
jgi:hypothetical protein